MGLGWGGLRGKKGVIANRDGERGAVELQAEDSRERGGRLG